MIQSQNKHFGINTKYEVTFCGLAYDDSIVVAGSSYLKHISASGSVLKEKNIKFDYHIKYQILDKDKLLVFSHGLKVLYLRDYSFIDINIPHTMGMHTTYSIEFFTKSRIIAVHQKSPISTLTVEYFSLNLEDGCCKMIEQYESPKIEDLDSMNDAYKVRKLNEDSKLGWWKQKQGSNFPFFFQFVEIGKDQKIRKRTVSTKGFLLKQQGQINKIYLNSIWEVSSDKYFVYTYHRNDKKSSNIFRIDLKNGKTINCSHSWIKLLKQMINPQKQALKSSEAVGQFTIFDICDLKELYSYPQGKQKHFLFENMTEKIFGKVTQSGSEQKFYRTSENFILAVQKRGKTTNEESYSTLTKIKILDMKDFYLTLLLHLNEDFDDDLLQDAMEILNT